MKIDLRYDGVSCFAVPLPLDPTVENRFGSWLPECLNTAAINRRSEFIAGRYCAYRAGSELGAEILRLPISRERDPLWPHGLIGSISHSRQMAIACVARSGRYRSIGIDTEEIMGKETMDSIRSSIMDEDERRPLEEGGGEGAPGISVLFSAKESLFKALWPLYQTYIDFKEARLTSFSMDKGDFSLKVRGLQGTFQGKFIFQEKNIITVLPVKS